MWIAVARHNFKWLKIKLSRLSALRVKTDTEFKGAAPTPRQLEADHEVSHSDTESVMFLDSASGDDLGEVEIKACMAASADESEIICRADGYILYIAVFGY